MRREDEERREEGGLPFTLLILQVFLLEVRILLVLLAPLMLLLLRVARLMLELPAWPRLHRTPHRRGDLPQAASSGRWAPAPT